MIIKKINRYLNKYIVSYKGVVLSGNNLEYVISEVLLLNNIK